MPLNILPLPPAHRLCLPLPCPVHLLPHYTLSLNGCFCSSNPSHLFGSLKLNFFMAASVFGWWLDCCVVIFKDIVTIYKLDLYFEHIYIYIQFSGDGRGGVTGTYEIKNRSLTLNPEILNEFLLQFMKL